MLDFGFYLMDCIEGMKQFPDNYFDLCIADPPYGGVTQGGYMSNPHTCDKLAKAKDYHLSLWSMDKPSDEYFKELFRVSKNQIIWGGNYFTSHLHESQCWIVWDKENGENNFADCELAWTSFNLASRIYKFRWAGMLQGNMKSKEHRIHPCLPKGEKVYFNNQWKNIEDVRIGDKNIFGRVSSITSHEAERIVKIRTLNNKETSATWNHPFLILRNNEIAWINAEQIKEGDQILWLKHTKRHPKDICATEKKMGNCEWNIALYGKNTLEKSRRGCKSTILTGIKPITIFPIYNLSHPLNINGFTKVADLKTGNGISRANVVESIKRLVKKIGISIKKQDGLHRDSASLVMSKRLSRTVKCELQTVGNVKIINEKTKVFNLTIDGIPAFETKVGISHNTQKPVALYEWLISKFANDGDIILDTHTGSASSLIACHRTRHKYVGFEIDETYYKKAKERLDAEIAQMTIYDFLEG